VNYYRIYRAFFSHCSSSELDSYDFKDFTLTSLLYSYFLLRQSRGIMHKLSHISDQKHTWDSFLMCCPLPVLEETSRHCEQIHFSFHFFIVNCSWEGNISLRATITNDNTLSPYTNKIFDGEVLNQDFGIHGQDFCWFHFSEQ